MKITAVLPVASIEPSLEFWVNDLGFAKTAEVPEGDRLGFVIVEKEGAGVMFQTETLVAEDFKELLAPFTPGNSMLFVEVPDIAEIEEKLKHRTPALARRTTFYGMDEIGFVEPGGHFVVFASRVKQ